MTEAFIPPKLNIEDLRQAAEELGLSKHKRFSSTIYHYTSLKVAKKILRSARFKLSDPNGFNDPFDMHTKTIGFDSDLVRLMKFCKVAPNVTVEDFERHLFSKGITESNRESFFKKLIQESVQRQKNIMGVVCYSETCDNALMWSHYADKHRGINIGFEYKSLGGSFIMPVVYKKEMIQPNYDDGDAKLYVFLGFMKSHVWKYEKEVRVLCTNVERHCDENRILSFDKSLVREIRVGYNAPEGTEKTMFNLLKKYGYDYKSIHIKRMKINPKTYSFEKQ